MSRVSSKKSNSSSKSNASSKVSIKSGKPNIIPNKRHENIISSKQKQQNTVKVSNFKKLVWLIWKNSLVQWSHKLQLLGMILFPAIFGVIVIRLRSSTVPELKDMATYSPVKIDNLDKFKQLNVPREEPLLKKLLYSPINPLLDKLVSEAAKSLGLDGHEGFQNAAKLQNALTSGNYLAGVEFENSKHDITTYPVDLVYSLRFPSELRTADPKLDYTWKTNRLFPPMGTPGPRNPKDDGGGVPVGYLEEGFLPIQNAISMAYLKLAGNAQNLPKIEMQRFPYPAYLDDPMVSRLISLLALLVMISFTYPCTVIAQYITSEKENQLKEAMKIIGLNNWLHWMAWFINSFIIFAIISAFIVILIMNKWTNGVAVLTYCSWSVLLLFLLVFNISTICLCFLLCTFFSKATTASSVIGILLLITYLPMIITENLQLYDDMSLSQKLGLCLLPNTAMGYGFKTIINFEASAEGLQWGELFSPADKLSLGVIMIVMLASSVLFMIICLYVEQVMPGKYGVAKPWNFCLTPMCRKRETVQSTSETAVRQNADSFEEEPSDKQIGVKVQNLKKSFGQKEAVKGVSMNMYEDEITVLLGHNGAGKTTTISMLTGMFSPTSGTAIVNGSDIRTNIKGARSSLGFCPQHNVLFDEISAANHVRFFSRVKGLRGKEVENEVNKYLTLLELKDKANVPSSTLSGGMKRKLSVCCALCGGAKVVFLDEPSSGMDPAARRQLWNLLQEEKIGRTMLITTHLMDEADVLGDRIAIMSAGELKSFGTSFFLRKKYGGNYHLICVKRVGCDATAVTALLNKYIPGIQPESDIGTELSYQLPEKYSSVFESMFSALESKSDDLLLESYGVGVTSMEEIFMKVGADEATDNTKDAKTSPKSRYFLILVLFGFAMIPLTYLMAFLFTKPASGFGVYCMFNICAGLLAGIGIDILAEMQSKFMRKLANNLQWFFRLIPHFSLYMGVSKIYKNWATRNACKERLETVPPATLCEMFPICCKQTPYFEIRKPGVLLEVLYLICGGVVFFLILITCDYGLFGLICHMIKKLKLKPPKPKDEYRDDDVENEKQRIASMTTEQLREENLVLDRVAKYYGHFLAVNQVSLLVNRAECFGLLGVNGAGKTTTFKMMTGDVRIDFGKGYIKGNSLKPGMRKVYREIGYCPQFDALLEFLTGREVLRIFCLIRGVRKERIKMISEELARSFDFMKHIDKQVHTYSGGNKRKLSTAVAVIGSPSVIFLDEPTSGMDPGARRQLWNMVCRIRDSGKSIVLTSHSMEECEALCTRLAIMVSGDFKCMGSNQHLKSKFSKGFILKTKVGRKQIPRGSISSSQSTSSSEEPLQRDIQRIKEFVEREFPNASLKEEYQDLLTFYIPISGVKWSRIFGVIEHNRKNLNIEDYSITQTTLEEIFLQFAEKKHEDASPENEVKSKGKRKRKKPKVSASNADLEAK